MNQANTMTVQQSREHYLSMVQSALTEKGAQAQLSDVEITLVERAWRDAWRPDLCAAVIRTDRHLEGAGLPRTSS